MTTNCKKCGMIKMTPDTRCLCNVKKYDASKLSKKTRKEKAPTKIKKVSEKRKQRLATGKGEAPFFKNIFKKKFKLKENFCIICKEELIAGTEDEEGNVGAYSFPHILPKGTYPELRLLESNLQYLVCSIEHHDKFDSIINELKADIGLEELKKQIIDGKTLDLKKYLDYEL